MTTARKVVMIVATVLVVAGAALSFGSFAAAGFDFANLSNTRRDWVAETVTLPTEAEAPHTAIMVKGSSEDVRFEPSDGDAIEVEYWTNNDREVSVIDQDGVVTIDEPSRNDFHIMLLYLGDFKDRSTVVKVPRSFAGSISVETSSAGATFTNLSGLAALSATSSSGPIHAVEIEADQIELRASSGSVEGAGLQAAHVSASSTSGIVTLADVEATDAIQASTSSGSQRLSRLNAPAITAHSSSGRITAASLAADDIVLEASSGRIEAVIAGTEADYEVFAAASSGSVEAPSGTLGADKRVSAHTSSGAIRLSFTASADLEPRGGATESSEKAGAPEAPAAPEAPTAP